MSPTLDQISCASLPLPQLAVLAGLRRESEIRVLVRGDRAWVSWPAGFDEVLRRIYPVPGVELFARKDRHWYPLGRHLPTFGVPRALDDESIPLATALVPAPIEVAPPGRQSPGPARLGLVRHGDEVGRPATALRCRLHALSAWAEAIPSPRLKTLRAAVAGEVVLVLGSPLPTIPEGNRYWGNQLLIPLGFRIDPSLPEAAIRRSLGIAATEILLFTPLGYERIAGSLFKPLTLAGIRLAERSLRA